MENKEQSSNPIVLIFNQDSVEMRLPNKNENDSIHKEYLTSLYIATALFDMLHDEEDTRLWDLIDERVVKLQQRFAEEKEEENKK